MTPYGNNESSSFFKEFIGIITRSFWLKLLSFLFSVVLFFIVRTDKEVVYDRMARIKITTAPSMTVVGPSEHFLNVSVRVQNSLFSVPPTDAELSGEVSVLASLPEKISVKISRDNFPYLPKQYALFIERPYFDVEIDKLAEKNVPVQVVLKGEPAAGLGIGKVLVVPDQVRVAGGKQELATLESLVTQPINIDGIQNTLTSLVPMDINEKSSLKIPVSSVQVVVSVKPKSVSRLFRAVPIDIVGVPHASLRFIELRPRYIDVEVAGDKNALQKISPADVSASISGADLHLGWQEEKVILKIPNKLSLIKMVPDTVSVYLKKHSDKD